MMSHRQKVFSCSLRPAVQLAFGLFFLFTFYQNQAGAQVDSLPQPPEDKIDFKKYSSRLFSLREQAEPHLTQALEEFNEAADFLGLLQQEDLPERDRQRFLQEAGRHYEKGAASTPLALRPMDSLTNEFFELVQLSLARNKVYPHHGKALKMQSLYYDVGELREALIGRRAQVQSELLEAGVWSAISLREAVHAGDTQIIQRFFVQELGEKTELPGRLSPLTVRKLAGGGMEIAISFDKTQPLFQLSDPALTDVRTLVNNLGGSLAYLAERKVKINGIDLVATLRGSEEDLSYLPKTVVYAGEFGPDLRLHYTFSTENSEERKQLRSLPVPAGPQSFLAATALKLEGMRRAFANNKIDSSTISLEICAPVVQDTPERFSVRMVIY